MRRAVTVPLLSLLLGCEGVPDLTFEEDQSAHDAASDVRRPGAFADGAASPDGGSPEGDGAAVVDAGDLRDAELRRECTGQQGVSCCGMTACVGACEGHCSLCPSDCAADQACCIKGEGSKARGSCVRKRQQCAGD